MGVMQKVGQLAYAYPQLSTDFLREEAVDLRDLLSDLGLGPAGVQSGLALRDIRIEVPTDPDRVRYDGMVQFRVVERLARRGQK